MSVVDASGETREYLVTASSLRLDTPPSGPLSQRQERDSILRDAVSSVVVVWHDVTERRLREAERQAREHARQLEAIFEAMTDGVFVYDSSGNIVQVNTAARRSFALDRVPNYTSQPLEERLARLIVHDAQGQPFPRERLPQLRLLRGEVLSGEQMIDVLVQGMDGREFQVSIGGAPLYDREGCIIGAVMTVRDMSERYRLERRFHEAERQARERAKQLEAIFEAMTESVFVFDSEGRMVQMNKAAHLFLERLLLSDYADRPLEERIALNVAYDEQGQQLPPEHLPTARILSGEVLTPENAVEMALHDLHGQAVHLSVTGGPLPDSLGHIIGAV